MEKSNHLIELFSNVRAKTLELVKTLEKDDFIVQTAPFMSPPKWHLGHVSWLFEVVLEKTSKNHQFHSDELKDYLNSYYNQFGKPQDKGRRGTKARPTLDQILDYFGIVTNKVTHFLKKEPLDETTYSLYMLGINHEWQHQELLVYDLKHLLLDQYQPVKQEPLPIIDPPKSGQSVKIDKGLYTMGYSGDQFCYDVELPEHKVYLNDYRIDLFPVSNKEYMQFIDDGGYKDFKYWLSDGWDVKTKNKWEAPLYWEKEKGHWIVRDFLGRQNNHLDEPVSHVSYYEADAYCRWAGKRLPSEAEWEKAACWNEDKQQKMLFPWGNKDPSTTHANLLETNLWNPSALGSYNKGKSYYGCQQMIGDVWEWTSSEFSGYPGFKTHFAEYNDKWFAGQKVLRGGSFATPQLSIRASYRNFFRLDDRWQIAGFRCVSDH